MAEFVAPSCSCWALFEKIPKMRPSAPACSVVVPVFNGADYVVEAIESILDQSLQCFEILAVNDGSIDQSLEMLEDARSRHPDKLRILQHPDGKNHGIVSTYELGIAHARGNYVAFLEQDDTWSPNYLERKVEIFEANPSVGVVMSPYKVVTDGLLGHEMTLRQWMLQWRMARNVPFRNFGNLIKFNNVASFSCFSARRELLSGTPTPDDRLITYYDWWILLWLSMQTHFFYDSESICYWRQHRDSTLGRQTWQEHCDRASSYFSSMYAVLDSYADQLKPELRREYALHRRSVPEFLCFVANRDLRSLLAFSWANPRWAFSTTASLLVNYWKFGAGETASVAVGRGPRGLRRLSRPSGGIRAPAGKMAPHTREEAIMKLCVTGHDDQGKAVFSYVGAPNQSTPGSYDVWSTKGPISVPDDSDPKAPAAIGYFPSLGETSFKLVSVPPHRKGDAPLRVADEIAHMFDADDPGMHTTDTIDYIYIVSGEVDLELDDGRKERLSGGDCVIQRGTRHAWRVVGDEPLVMCAILLGAERRG